MIKFLLVGCGNIGRRHAALAADHGLLEAVCDIDEKKIKSFSAEYNCYGYTSYKEMLHQHPDADALILCTPNGLHASQAIDALRAGFHVLCEKPMALSVADAKRMIMAAKKAGKHLMVVKQNRFNPSVLALKKLIDKNKIGQIYSIQLNCLWNRPASYYRNSRWRGTRKLDGGILFTQFSHFIDLMYWFFGPIKSAKGNISNVAHANIEIEDTAVFTFVTQSGIPGTLHCSNNAKNKNYEGSITVLAEKATIKIGGAYLNYIEYQEPEIIKIENSLLPDKVNQYKGYQGSMNNHDLVYEELMQVISGKKKQYTSGEEAMHSVKMIEQ
ncbi:MAG: Gfo/Idh/MocA family protein, partial [Bacteroidota bacterium]